MKKANKKDLLALAAEKQKRAKAALPTFQLETLCHAKQLEIARNPHLRKVVRTSRRFGKTILGVFYLLETALNHPGSISLFITLTRIYAKQLAWDLLKSHVRRFGLVDEDSIKEVELTIEFPNGSKIQLIGANTDDETLKIKGRKYALVVIDEFQIFPAYGRKLIDEVIEPAVLNAQGTILVLGTPPPSPIGPFVELIQSSEWKAFHGTGRDNPFYEVEAGMSFDEAKAAFIKRRKCTDQDPIVLREFEGELVSDPDSLAVHIPDHALYETLPDVTGSVLGVDIGWGDATAIACLLWNPYGVAYLAEEDIARHQVESVLGKKLQQHAATYKPFIISIDTAGNKISFESLKDSLFSQGIYLPLEPRKVMPVEAQIAILNAAFAEGRIKVRKSSRVYQDSQLVVWEDGIVGGKLAKQPHSDAIPALIYAYLSAVPIMPALISHDTPPNEATDPDFDQFLASHMDAQNLADEDRRHYEAGLTAGWDEL